MPEADMVESNMNLIAGSRQSPHTPVVPSPVAKFAEREVGELMDKAFYIVQMDESLRRTSWENWAREVNRQRISSWQR